MLVYALWAVLQEIPTPWVSSLSSRPGGIECTVSASFTIIEIR